MRRFAIVLVCLLGIGIGKSQAEEVLWRPVQSQVVSTSPAIVPCSFSTTEPQRQAKPVSKWRPNISWNGPSGTVSSPEIELDQNIITTSFRPVIRAQGPPGPGSDVPPLPPPGLPPPLPKEDPYNCSEAINANQPEGFEAGVGGFWNNVQEGWTAIVAPAYGRRPLESDHLFDDFISPVSNPLYFEDPRSLTEVRPIFIYQKTPSSTPFYAGGDIFYFGVQGRLALTERFSFVVSNLGGIWQTLDAPAGNFQDGGAFAEFHIGPKFTFIRNKEFDALVAGGLTFELPIGGSQVFQNTGSLSLTPYISYGQGFLKTYYGKFHFMNTTGYSIGVDGDRTDRFFSSFHLDYDVLNYHRYYPFIELNWALYPRSGNVQNINFEGRDLINFGAQNVGGNNDLSLALGMRFKFTEVIQLGGAVEFPLLSRKDLMDFRLTFDVIFRY